MNRLDRITARLLRRRWGLPRVTEAELAELAGRSLYFEVLRVKVAVAPLVRPFRRLLRRVFA